MRAEDDRKFDYAVIVALDEEATYFIDVIDCGEPFDFEGFTTRIITALNWQPWGTGVLICSGEMGKDAAHASAKAAIEVGGAATIFNIGIAGRVDTDLAIGDVVIPTLIHDVTNGSKLGGAPGNPTWKLSPEVRAVPGRMATQARTDFAARSNSLRLVNEKIKGRFGDFPLLGERGVQVLSRPHACVPAVIAFDALRAALAEVHRKMATMDMETAGIVAAATGTNVEVLCIRAISDGGDHGKRELELQYNDENRRFAMEAATFVLDRTISLHSGQPAIDPDTVPNPKDGLRFVVTSDDRFDPDWMEDYQRQEELFSLLIVDQAGERLKHPIAAFVRQLVGDEHGTALLIGEKGAGKTTFLNYLQHALVARQARGATLAEDTCETAYFVRLSSYEEWDQEESGQLDAELSMANLKEDCERIVKQARETSGNVFVIIDGLNRTGKHRMAMAAEALRVLRTVPRIRFALSAEQRQDIIQLDGTVTVDVQGLEELRPLPIEDAATLVLVEHFAALVKSQHDPATVLADMKDKGVAFVDLFLLGQFFGKFRRLVYAEFKYLSECYNQFCVNELSTAGSPAALEPRQVISEVAETAFDILISHKQDFTDVRRRETAQLISNHASVTAFLVARHVIDTLINRENARSRINSRLNYVFPAEINKFTKQIMLSDPHVEEQVVARIKREFHGLGTLARSHSAYLAGRVSEARAPEMRDFLKRTSPKLTTPQPGQLDHRMLRRSVLISRSMLGDGQAEREYAELLLRDPEESSFNRGFHLEYYGDVPFEPARKMASGDDKDRPCDRTFARLLDRIHSRPEDHPPLIELITLLSLVQFRLLSGSLRKRHRSDTLELLDRPGLKRASNLTHRIRGYLGRMREDLSAETFDLSTILDDWVALPNTPRTGWLRRRRDAGDTNREFWADRRIESVAEHVFSAVGLATLFLKERGDEDENYSRAGVIELLVFHDLAEGRLGDKLPQNADAEAEQAELWKYGAFGTYPGLEHMWRIPVAFREFTAGFTPNARVAQDLDRLQFMLQSRLYRGGMSDKDIADCEKTSDKIVTKTVSAIFRTVANFPIRPRFSPPDPQY